MTDSPKKSRKPSSTQALTSIEANVKIDAGRLPVTISDYLRGRKVKKIIAYYRVSTERQGKSGLGLEGQHAAVAAFVTQRDCEVIASYQEIESGKKADRPELAKALAHAKRSKATLVVAKLDRLARNVAFLASLMDAGVDFIALDMEHANRLTIHILAAVAEAEAKAISDRTKSALAAAKARGAKLGSARPGHWDGREESRLRGAKKGAAASMAVRSTKAIDEYADLLPNMQSMRASGSTLSEIAERLNNENHTTRRGKAWNVVQVKRVLDRAKN